VASIQVLKDAGAASIYGSRANNGVIIITTKKGQTGRPVVTYDAYYGTQVPKHGNVWRILSPQDMAQLKFNILRREGADTTIDPLYGPASAAPILPDYIVPKGAREGDPSVDPALYYVNPGYTDGDDLNSFYRIVRANKQGTDWYHSVFRHAPVNSQNISISGASDKARYMMSVNYFNQQGVLINTYLKRYTIRANTSFNISRNIRVGENMAYSVSVNPHIDALQGYSAVAYTFREQPIIPVYDIKGNYAGNYGGVLGDAHNPVATQQRTANDKHQDNRLFGNVYAEVDLLKGLTLRSSFGGSVTNGQSHTFSYPTYEDQENQLSNSYTENSYWGNTWTWTNTAQYSTILNDVHSLKVLAGTEAYDSHSGTFDGTTFGYFVFDPNYTTLTSGSGARQSHSTRASEGLWSQFARFDYGFRDKYLVSGTLRRDGSSKFKNNQYGWFPAITAAWRLSGEPFMDGVSWISDLKVRGGWGIMGNQQNLSSDNAFNTYYGNVESSYYDISGTNNSVQQGFQQKQIANPDAKWEKDINTNIGFDATLFKGAINITADYYIKSIRDLLYNPELPGTFGRGVEPYVNIAQMKNKGVDLSISGHTKFTRDLSFDATLTFTSYNNRITKVTDATNYFLSGDVRTFSDKFVRNQVGQAVGSFYGYKIIGFWNSIDEIATADGKAQQATGSSDAAYQTDEGVGRFRYADVNGDGQITADDRTILGNPSPSFNYGINLGLTYKNFDFSIFIYGSQGNKVWNQVRWWTDFYSSFLGAKSYTALYDSWTETRHNARVAVQETNGNSSTNGVPNSYFVENGSYLRAKNLMLGYTFPKTTLQKVGIESLRVYVQAANLFTITKYSGQDPEINGKGVTEFGIDEGSYPSVRQFTAGVNLKF
jgi:TonB-linked SusC/RagA family outer membrane protein